MLKNVSLHVHEDEGKQAEIEKAASRTIQEREKSSVNAFQRFMPNVHRQLRSIRHDAISIICNRFGEINIVNSATGRVFYGTHPEQEVEQQLNSFRQNAPRFTLGQMPPDTLSQGVCGFDSPLAKVTYAADAAPDVIDVLVVMGIGGGLHLQKLLSEYQINHLVVYEPEPAYLIASLTMTDWRAVFDLAQAKSTAIYLQLGKDSRDLAEDLSELNSVTPFSSFYVYRHYNHPVFNEVHTLLCEHGWDTFRQKVVRQFQTVNMENYLPEWSLAVDTSAWHTKHLRQERLQENLSALEKYFPALFKEFKEYTPRNWFPVGNTNGEVNLIHQASMTAHYGESPCEDSERHAEVFSRHPNRDGLVLGYKGNKLKKYLHYEMVAKVETVLKGVEESQGSLPQTIKSMIAFGIGAGYELQALCDAHHIEKLFICEPSRDFFYASLYAIDWASLLSEVDKREARIYINVGDDGSHLIEDLLTQFHSVGPYILANTYFLQGYYNAPLVSAIAQLREQLQVIISMGDFFDHSRYCIAHTRWGMENRIPLLKRDAAKNLSVASRDVPVFLIGNGPSLDGLIDIIRDNADKAILISCGTALRALYQQGITPDYHAEIESNRATFDWNVRVGDLDYLKKITLISCNGLHPDTAGLFKNTLISLKEGESATVSFTEIFGLKDFASLRYAYPTVTNFAANMVAELGFRQVYLCGVDLGFVDNDHHHSRKSGYYDSDGKALYDYAKSNDASILIEGNLRPFVKTKYEFKVAKKVLEQSLRGIPEVYNLNDGAKIVGATALPPENVLILNHPDDKSAAMHSVQEQCFITLDVDDYLTRFNQRYVHERLVADLEALQKVVDQEVHSLDDAEKLIDAQREVLVRSYLTKRSLAFFYLNGTLNFINSAMMKTISVDEDNGALDAFGELLTIWRNSLAQIKVVLTEDERSFCFISSFESQRRDVLISEYFKKHDAHFRCQPESKARYINDIVMHFGLAGGKGKYQEIGLNWHFKAPHGLVIATSQTEALEVIKNATQSVFCLPGDWNKSEDPPICNDVRRAYYGIVASSAHSKISLILAKLPVTTEDEIKRYYDLSAFSDYYVYELGENLIALSTSLLVGEEQLLNDGCRAHYLGRTINYRDLVLAFKSKDELQLIRKEYQNTFPSLAVNS